MPTCSVAGCTKEKRNKIDPEHKFFSFPKTSPLVDKWIKFCRKDSLTKDQCLNKGQRICSIHFKEEYIEIPLRYRLLPQFAPKNMRVLRKDAVPTIRNPKKRKEGEEDENKTRQKKMEYSRIVAELLEQSEKDAAAEKESQEKEAAEDGVDEETSTPASKKTPKSKKQSASQKPPKKIKTEQSSPDTNNSTPKSKTGNKKSVIPEENASCTKSKSRSSGQKKKVSFADPGQPLERPDTDDEIEVYEPDIHTEDLDTDNEIVINNSDLQADDTAAELQRLQRENKKFTDLTIKQSLQIADLIKQRNDLWREKGDLWFRKRVDQQ